MTDYIVEVVTDLLVCQLNI